jgi:hypothetical protein
MCSVTVEVPECHAIKAYMGREGKLCILGLSEAESLSIEQVGVPLFEFL